MGAQLVQFSDGSAGIVNDYDGKTVARWGGAAAPAAGAMSYRAHVTAVTPLIASDTTAVAINIQNSLGYDVIVERFALNITTRATTTSSTASFGTSATSTGSSSNFLDSVAIDAAAVVDNITDKGTSGKSRQLWTNGTWITGSKTTGSASGIVGSAYITYVPV